MIHRALNLRLACQAAAMKVSANIIVQLIARWRVLSTGGNAQTHPTHAVFDWQQVLEFAIYGSFNSQLGNVIQYALEDWFPTTRRSSAEAELERQRNEKRDDDSPLAAGAAALAATAGPGGGHPGGRKSPSPRLPPPASSSSESSSWLSRWRDRLKLDKDVIWRNLFAKLILDQTIGLFMSGCIFITITNIARVPHPSLVLPIIHDRVGKLIAAGWHIWPLVALCNFLWVPVRSRVLVAVFVGFGWSIFLSVFAMTK